MADTTYVSEARYEVSGNAEKELGRLAKALHMVAEKSERGRERFREFAKESALMGLGAVGVGIGLHSMVEKIFEAGREFDNAKSKIAGTLFATAAWNKSIQPVDKAATSLTMAGEAMEEVEKIETRFVQPLGELQEGYEQLALSTGRAHVKLAELPKLLELTAGVAKMTGVSVGQASVVIGKFISTGMMRAGAGKLGKVMEDVQRLGKHSTAEQRLKAVTGMLEKYQGAADVLSQGFDESLKRIGMGVDRVVRGLTTPVFMAITKELDKWSQKLLATNAEGKKMVEVYADKLLGAFNTMKDVTGAIADRWKEILAAWLAMKAAGGISSGLDVWKQIMSRPAQMGFGFMGGASKLGPIIDMFGGKLVVATAGLVGLAVAANEFAKWVDRNQTRDLARHETTGAGGSYESSAKAMAAGNIGLAFKQLSSLGLAGSTGKLSDPQMLRETLAGNGEMMKALATRLGMQTPQRGEYETDARGRVINAQEVETKFLGAVDVMVSAFERNLENFRGNRYDQPIGPDYRPDQLNRKGPPVINIHNMNITQDFKEADPDRVYIEFKESLERHVVAPLTLNTAPTAVRG